MLRRSLEFKTPRFYCFTLRILRVRIGGKFKHFFILSMPKEPSKSRKKYKENLPSYDQMKKILAEVMGIGSVVHPMCRNSCVTFTGPFMDLDHCPKCGEPKHSPISRKYQQEFHTMPTPSSLV